MKQRIYIIAFLLITTIGANMKAQTNTENQKTLRYLALGDSYTIGESVAESERWPVYLAARLASEGYSIETPKIIAKTGWRTDQLQEAIEADGARGEWDLVSLLIGVNNQYQGKTVESYKIEFNRLVQMALKLAGGNAEKVFIVSIPDYGKTPFGAAKEFQIAKELKAYNKVNKAIAKEYDIQYFNITPISEKAKNDLELVADDTLHPSGKMYKAWVDMMFNKVLKMVKDND
jgi:lysophospholipase L1-like esterase